MFKRVRYILPMSFVINKEKHHKLRIRSCNELTITTAALRVWNQLTKNYKNRLGCKKKKIYFHLEIPGFKN